MESGIHDLSTLYYGINHSCFFFFYLKAKKYRFRWKNRPWKNACMQGYVCWAKHYDGNWYWHLIPFSFSQLLLPRIFWMYVISAVAFFFYVTRMPERLNPGLVNYVGSSHQIWHILIVAALYHWHNTGLVYLIFRSQNPCAEEYATLYSIASSTNVVDM